MTTLLIFIVLALFGSPAWAINVQPSGGGGQTCSGDISSNCTQVLGVSHVNAGSLPSTHGGAGAVTGILKANGSGVVSAAVSATDFAPATTGSSVLLGNSAGGFSLLTGNTLAAHNFATQISVAGVLIGAQPAFTDISGSLASTQMPALTGDTTTSAGATVTTTGKVNGVSYGTSPATDSVPVITAANTATYTAVSGCLDSGGNHLNYNTATHAFSCGSSSSGGASVFISAMSASAAYSGYGVL